MENQTKGSMNIKIIVTKSVLRKSMMCVSTNSEVYENCAIARAVRDIFPLAKVNSCWIAPFGTGVYDGECDPFRIYLPLEAMEFINTFDSTSRKYRPQLPEFSFEIEVPDSVIEKIGISHLEEEAKKRVSENS